MNQRATLLAEKRRRLLDENAALRANLMHQLVPLGHTLAMVDSGLRVAARVRRHPEWIAGAAAGLLLLGPRRVSVWLRNAATGLRTWRQVSPLLRGLISR